MARLDSLLGFAQRAGQLVSGETAVELAVSRNKARLVILALDASENTVDRFEALCSRKSVPFRRAATKERLGNAIGRSPRASLAVLDPRFAGPIAESLRSEDMGVVE